MRNHEPKKLTKRDSKSAFAQIQLHVIRTNGIEGFLEVIQIVIPPNAFYQHVVNVDLNVSPNLMCEHLVHQPLIRGPCVFEFEWHNFVAEETLAGDE